MSCESLPWSPVEPVPVIWIQRKISVLSTKGTRLIHHSVISLHLGQVQLSLEKSIDSWPTSPLGSWVCFWFTVNKLKNPSYDFCGLQTLLRTLRWASKNSIELWETKRTFHWRQMNISSTNTWLLWGRTCKFDSDPSKDLSTSLLVNTWLALKWDAQTKHKYPCSCSALNEVTCLLLSFILFVWVPFRSLCNLKLNFEF